MLGISSVSIPPLRGIDRRETASKHYYHYIIPLSLLSKVLPAGFSLTLIVDSEHVKMLLWQLNTLILDVPAEDYN